MKKKFIKIPVDFFKDTDFKVTVSPFGDKKCCCGYTDCTDLGCLMYAIEKGVL